MKKKRFGRRIRAISLTGVQVGLIFSLGFFVFQISQSWVDVGITNLALRWILPTSLSIGVITLLGSISILIGMNSKIEDIPPVEKLALAIHDYGVQLNRDGRDQALISLRNSFSTTLHILGFHDIRTQLGEVVLQSAAILHDNATKAEVLIDDLGWANFLKNNKFVNIINVELEPIITRFMHFFLPSISHQCNKRFSSSEASSAFRILSRAASITRHRNNSSELAELKSIDLNSSCVTPAATPN